MDGAVLESPYRSTCQTTRSTETFANGTELIRSGFRPGDDSTIFQFFIPANLMFCSYLESAAEIMAKLGARAPQGLAEEMRSFAISLRQSIETYSVIPSSSTPDSADSSSEVQTFYAYDVDGFRSAAVMDDAISPLSYRRRSSGTLTDPTSYTSVRGRESWTPVAERKPVLYARSSDQFHRGTPCGTGYGVADG